MDKARTLIPLITTAALLDSMAYDAGRANRRPATLPQKKGASPYKRAKRKMVQASRKKNR
jgi:hypothetical protein